MKRLDESGFSLIELVVVIAMVAIISAIAIPNMIGWRGERQLRGAVNNLLGNLQLARMQAIREAEIVAISFNEVGGTYSIFFDSKTVGNIGELDAGERTIRKVTLPTGVTIQAASFSGGVAWMNYNTKGMPDKFGSVTMRNSAGTQLKLVVNKIGRLRIE